MDQLDDPALSISPAAASAAHAELYSGEQVAAAGAALRIALGIMPEFFDTHQLIEKLSDEIEQLRFSGRTNEEICSIIAREAGIEIAPAAIDRFYASPGATPRASGAPE